MRKNRVTNCRKSTTHKIRGNTKNKLNVEQRNKNNPKTVLKTSDLVSNSRIKFIILLLSYILLPALYLFTFFGTPDLNSILKFDDLVTEFVDTYPELKVYIYIYIFH